MLDKFKKQQNWIISLSFVVTVYLVFFFNVDITRYRIFQELWNLGHIILFIGINYFVYKKLVNPLKLPIIIELLLIIISSCVIGYTIEILQTFTGRNKSNYDVLLDMVGGGVAFYLFSKKLNVTRGYLKYGLSFLVLTFTIVSLYPMYVNVVDAINQNNDFPVLLSNTNKREITRLKIDKTEVAVIEKKISGVLSHVLKITFNPAKYPTVGLQSFNEKWTGFNSLVFSIYNPAPISSVIIMRIHDREHKTNNFEFNDRFNYRIKLKTGWNKVRVNLAKIKSAPLNREMNMDKIEGLMFFKINLKNPETLYFSEIKLIK